MKRFIIAFLSTIILSAAYFSASADTLRLPVGLKRIEDEAFRDDASISEVILPEGIISIGANAFTDSGLTEINLPSTLTSIDNSALPEPGMLTVTAVKGSWAYDWAIERNYIRPETDPGLFATTELDNGTLAVTGYTGNETDIVIPADIDGKRVDKIGDYAFYYCESLTSVVIPKGVTAIGKGAFQGCNGLTSITIPDGVIIIDDDAFAACRRLPYIRIPKGVTNIHKGLFSGCSSLKSVSLPEGINCISEQMFFNCVSLAELLIPKGVTSIGGNAFLNCASLTEITIPEGVLSIDSSAFQDCRKLSSITLPEGLINIGNSAFLNNNSLVDIKIPNSVASIGDWAFNYCTSITNITVPEGVTTIGARMFNYCESLVSVSLPASVNSIESSAFFNCNKLTIYAPEGSFAWSWARENGYSDSKPFFFGHYDQDGDLSNGKEAIEWIQLERNGDEVTLITKYPLEAKPYNEDLVNVTWETCTLRNWLNTTFLNDAFTVEEQEQMVMSTVKNPSVLKEDADGTQYYVDGGNDTSDKIYLLSADEVERYFTSDNARQCEPTQTAIDHGAQMSYSYGGVCWWLRTPGNSQDTASIVNTKGAVYKEGIRVDRNTDSVRPVVVLQISDEAWVSK